MIRKFHMLGLMLALVFLVGAFPARADPAPTTQAPSTQQQTTAPSTQPKDDSFLGISPDDFKPKLDQGTGTGRFVIRLVGLIVAIVVEVVMAGMLLRIVFRLASLGLGKTSRDEIMKELADSAFAIAGIVLVMTGIGWGFVKFIWQGADKLQQDLNAQAPVSVASAPAVPPSHGRA